VSTPIHPDTHDFLYSRVRVEEAVLDTLLSRDGVYLTKGRPELMFRAYARTRAEVYPTTSAMRDLGWTLWRAADELDEYAAKQTFKGDGRKYRLRRLRIWWRQLR
jgi:hypothetical protein